MKFNELKTVYSKGLDQYMIELEVNAMQAPTGEPQTKFIERLIQDWEGSTKLEDMNMADKYMNEGNQAIKDKLRVAVDADGQLLQLPHLSNTRLSHAFLPQLTEQKINYLLAKELTITSDDEAYTEKLREYLDKSFIRLLKTLGEHAITYGLAWLYVYYDRFGNMKFKRVSSKDVIPIWADSDKTILDALIHKFIIEEYDDEGKATDVLYVNYYDDEGVWKYKKVNGNLVRINDLPNGHFHYNLDKEDSQGEADGKEQEGMFSRIPFIAFRYNRNEKPLLNKIKSLIDEYDAIRSANADIIKDTPNSIMVIKNYQGLGSETPEKDISRFMRNVFNTRMAFVMDDGDVSYLSNPFDDLNYKNHAEQIRKNIYEFGGGIDVQEANFGHASGVAIRFRYKPLTQDCYAMGNEFIDALDKLKWFIDFDLYHNGGIDYRKNRVDFVFNGDAILDETEKIANIKNSWGIVSEKTALEQHPFVENAEEEMKQKRKEEEEMLARYGEIPQDTDLKSKWGMDEFLTSEDTGKGTDLDERG